MAETLTTCACVSDDAYECWARRYGMRFDRLTIDHDGGPCECGCHEIEPCPVTGFDCLTCGGNSCRLLAKAREEQHGAA